MLKEYFALEENYHQYNFAILFRKIQFDLKYKSISSTDSQLNNHEVDMSAHLDFCPGLQLDGVQRRGGPC